jgi:Protein of unknown function (DUF3179)
MKKLFYLGIAGLLLFEIANIYFIMPMPGSQRMRSLDLAYFLYSWRWFIRGGLGLIAAVGIWPAFRANRWATSLILLATVPAGYLLKFQLSADAMFYQPEQLTMQPKSANQVKDDKIVIGVALNGQARAYPLQLIAYHHQVVDTLGGQTIMVTYCSVCRTGRVFAPTVKGQPEIFRLVGMDHFNAMFEDRTTKSWWRQVSGEAVTGPLKGEALPEVPSVQVGLAEWLRLHPHSLVMQPDPKFVDEYDSLGHFETGKSTSHLTRTDTLSWQEKSWVVGLKVGLASKAFDWNQLKRQRVINSKVGQHPVVLVLAADNQSFFAFARPDSLQFTLAGDTLKSGSHRFNFKGENQGGPTSPSRLSAIAAYQEFWHSWQTFNPDTEQEK